MTDDGRNVRVPCAITADRRCVPFLYRDSFTYTPGGRRGGDPCARAAPPAGDAWLPQ
jgi:hypothetical protein